MQTLSYDAAVEMFEDCLNCDGPIRVAGLEFYPSDILKHCDPVAYRCYLSDYVASLEDEFEVED